MQKTTFSLALAALVISVLALLRPFDAGPAIAQSGDRWRDERTYPPLVFNSKAWLDCTISSTRNGRQRMKTVSGQGFNFDATMAPIKDGKLRLKTPGMLYQFDAFPTASIPARFTGLGAGTITEMKAEVEVDVRRFSQPGGAGTEIQFSSKDIDPNSAYVEFTGLFVRQRDKKRFPFRVLFGAVTAGEGKVTPADKRPQTNLRAKSVVLGSPAAPATVTTALYEAEDDVKALR